MKSEKGIDLSELSHETKRDINFYIKENLKTHLNLLKVKLIK